MSEELANNRKKEHIRIIQQDKDVDRKRFYFDDLRLTHRALPELDLNSIDTSIELFGKTLSFPLLISSMTGGDDDMLRTINRNLAIAAEACQVAMGVGSQRVMFKYPEAEDSFNLRKYAPTAPLFSNLGAVQLNYGYGLAECQQCVDILGADGLFFHLNPLQEAIQPEGNTNFSGLADKIGDIATRLSVPVIVKEVGTGMSADDARELADRGIRYIDVAGSGGTSWSRIEHHRSIESGGTDLGILFQDWGIPTPIALIKLAPLRDRLTLFGSGGIRNGVDMAKAMILGASLCGLAKPFLAPAMQSPEAVISVIKRLHQEFRTAMFLLGIGKASIMIGNTNLLSD